MSATVSYKRIINVALPIIISGVAQNIVNVTDTAFLGRVSQEALGAAGNAGIFYFVLVITGMGFTTGSQIIIGRRNGEQNYAQIGKILENTLYLILPIATIVFFLVKFFSADFLASITQSKIILSHATNYLNYRIIGIFFAFINFAFIAFYVGITKTRVLTYTTILMSVVNVILDYILIFGKFGIEPLGIKGAALASVFAELTSCIFFIVYSLLKIDKDKYQLFKLKSFEWAIIKRVTKVGGPVMLQNFLSLSSWFIFFMIIEKLGERDLAISHIIRSIYMVFMIPLFGLSAATNTLVSNFIGEGNSNMVLTLIKKIIILSFCSTAIVFIISIFIPEQIISIYTNDSDLISSSINTLRIINFTMFFFSTAFILFNGVTGTGKTIVSLVIEAITIFIYLIATYYIAIELSLSLPYVWGSEFIYFTCLGTLSYFYLKKGNWKKSTI